MRAGRGHHSFASKKVREGPLHDSLIAVVGGTCVGLAGVATRAKRRISGSDGRRGSALEAAIHSVDLQCTLVLFPFNQTDSSDV